MFLDFVGWFPTPWSFRFFGLGLFCSSACSWYCFLGLGWGWFLRILSFLPPPPSVGVGLGNRPTHLWHTAIFPELRAGFRRFLAYSLLFCFSSYRPPFGSSWGAIRITLTTPTGQQDRLVSCVIIFFFPKTQTLSRPTHVAGDMAMAFVEDSFLPLKTKGYVSSFLADLPVQRCGSGI